MFTPFIHRETEWIFSTIDNYWFLAQTYYRLKSFNPLERGRSTKEKATRASLHRRGVHGVMERSGLASEGVMRFMALYRQRKYYSPPRLARFISGCFFPLEDTFGRFLSEIRIVSEGREGFFSFVRIGIDAARAGIAPQTPRQRGIRNTGRFKTVLSRFAQRVTCPAVPAGKTASIFPAGRAFFRAPSRTLPIRTCAAATTRYA